MTADGGARDSTVLDPGAVGPAPPLTPTRRRAPSQVQLLSRNEREARGAAARVLLPRESLADVGTTHEASRSGRPAGRPRACRGCTELLPLRYGRMSASAFAFYRGAALLMASDLAATPDSGLDVQLCGDAHMSNFGLYGTPERRMLFDLNDFDETLPGPFEWDVKRLLASVEIAARSIGAGDKERRKIAMDVAKAYRTAMREFAARPNIDVWYARLDVDEFLREHGGSLGKAQSRTTQSTVKKARSRDHLRSVEKLTEVVDGRRRFVSDPPLVQTLEELDGEARPGVPGRDGRAGARLPVDPPAGPPAPRRAVPARRHGPQGRRRGQRRHAGVDPAARGRRRRRPPDPAGQGGAVLGARAVPRRERVHAGRAAGGRGAAADAGGERRHARLAADARDRRGGARLLRPPAARLEGVGGHRGDAARGLQPVRGALRVDAGPRARTVGRPGGHRGVPRRRRRRPTRRSPPTPRRTPTATSRTTRRSWRRSAPVVWRRCTGSDARSGAARWVWETRAAAGWSRTGGLVAERRLPKRDDLVIVGVRTDIRRDLVGIGIPRPRALCDVGTAVVRSRPHADGLASWALGASSRTMRVESCGTDSSSPRGSAIAPQGSTPRRRSRLVCEGTASQPEPARCRHGDVRVACSPRRTCSTARSRSRRTPGRCWCVVGLSAVSLVALLGIRWLLGRDAGQVLTAHRWLLTGSRCSASRSSSARRTGCGSDRRAGTPGRVAEPSASRSTCRCVTVMVPGYRGVRLPDASAPGGPRRPVSCSWPCGALRCSCSLT